MNDALLQRVMAALDRPGGLEGDSELMETLASDPEARRMAQELAEVDALLRHHPVNERAAADGDALWQAVSARLDEEVPAEEVAEVLSAPASDNAVPLRPPAAGRDKHSESGLGHRHRSATALPTFLGFGAAALAAAAVLLWVVWPGNRQTEHVVVGRGASQDPANDLGRGPASVADGAEEGGGSGASGNATFGGGALSPRGTGLHPPAPDEVAGNVAAPASAPHRVERRVEIRRGTQARSGGHRPVGSAANEAQFDLVGTEQGASPRDEATPAPGRVATRDDSEVAAGQRVGRLEQDEDNSASSAGAGGSYGADEGALAEPAPAPAEPVVFANESSDVQVSDAVQPSQPSRERPTEAELRRAFAGVGGVVRACLAADLSRAPRVRVRVRFLGAGGVDRVVVAESWGNGDKAQCVSRAVRRIVLQPFAQSRYEVDHSFTFPAGD